MTTAAATLTEGAGPAPADLEAVREGYASVPQACAFLSVSRSTLYQLMDSGQLRFGKVGRSRRIPWRELRAFAARCLAG